MMKKIALFAVAALLLAACGQKAAEKAEQAEQAVAEKTSEVAKEAEAAAQQETQVAPQELVENPVDENSAEARVSEDQKY